MLATQRSEHYMNAMTDGEAVLRAATELNTDPAVALAWYSSEVLTVFEGKDPSTIGRRRPGRRRASLHRDARRQVLRMSRDAKSTPLCL